MVVLIVAAVLFLLGIVFKFVNKTTGNILLTCAVALSGAMWTFAVTIYIFLIHIRLWFYIPMHIILSALIITLIIVWIWGGIKNKKIMVPLLSAMAVCIVITGGFFAYDYYEYNIPTVGDSNSIESYFPYGEETKVAELDSKSTLTLTNNLPKMDGATALFPVYSAFAKAVYPQSEICSDSYFDYRYEDQVLKCTTTTGAYESIVKKDADIIFVAAPSEEQEKFAEENNIELNYTPIGKEAFVFFVNAKNPIDNITIEQIQQIYSGEITDWEELGVEKLGSIKAFQRDENSGSQSALQRLMKGKKLMQPPKEDVATGMSLIIDKTADYKNYKNAIGYSFRFYSTQMVANNQIKLLKVNGVYPNIENIENGTYPIASDFYAVTRSDADKNTQKLLEWIVGPQGQKLVEKTGYTPIKKN